MLEAREGWLLEKKKSGLSWGFFYFVVALLFFLVFFFFLFCSQSNHLNRSNVTKITSSTRLQINTLYHLEKVLVLGKVKILFTLQSSTSQGF